MSASTPPSLPANPPPVLLVLAGPAGSGKSTLCERIVREVPGFERVITTTTRAPRPGEINGVHYHFLTPEQFDAKIAADEFLEWAWVHGERRYGTLAASVLEPLKRGQSLAINLDVQGVASLREAAEHSIVLQRAMATIFILLEAPKFEFVINSGTREEDFAALLQILATARARAA
jgi:guanylate kinase